MSEIKIALDLFEKGDKLDKTINKLKAVDGLVRRINKNKVQLVSPEISKRINALNKITKIEKEIERERQKQIKSQAKIAQQRKENAGLLGKERQEVKRLQKLRLGAKTTKELQKVNKELQEAQMNVRKFGATGKKNTNTFSNALSSFGFKFNFLSDIISGTAFALASGLTNAIKDGIEITKQFEQGNANLASVLGKTASEITVLTEDAKRLGAVTAFSATEVSTLQTEFAKLGFNEQEILNATEATLSLAAATGSELGEAASVAGATLGGFGLDASETQRVVDVMAKSFSTSALDLEKFRESMKSAAPAAKAVGVSVEETTALLGTLANAGISGSKAGNNLKTSFINLNAAGLTLEQGLEKVANSQDKLGTAAQLVGKNAAASFLVLAEGTETTEKLTKGLENAGGAAEKMAKEQLNTLEGRLKILNSAWEGFVLSLTAGDSAFSSISKTLVTLATDLLSILTVSDQVDKKWLNQRESIASLNDEILNASDRYDELNEKTSLTVEEQEELDGIIQDLAKDVPTAVTEFDKYGKALKINTDVTKEYVKQQKNLLLVTNAEQIAETEDAIASLNGQLTRLTDEYKLVDGVLKRTIINQKSGTVRIQDATAKEVVAYQKKLESINNLIDGNEAYLAQLKGEKTAVQLALEAAQKAEEEGEAIESNIITLAKLREELSELKEVRADIDIEDKKALANNKQEIEDLQSLIDSIEKKITSTNKLTEAEKEALRLQELRLKGLINEQKERNSILLAIEQAAEEAENKRLSREEQEIKAVEDKYFKLIEKAKEFGLDTAQLEQDQQDEITRIQIKAEEERAEAAKRAAEKAAAEEIARLKRLESQRRKIEDERLQSAQDLNNLAKELAGENEKAQRAALLAEKGLAVAEITINGQRQIADIGADKELTEAQKKALQVQAGLQTSIGIATVLATGFAEGGYTGDGGKYDEAGIVHKGEFVNTKEQTSKYGMRNWTAQDFDKKVSEGHFNQFTDSGLFERQNMQFMTIEKKQVGYDFSKLENELKAVKNAILSKPVTSLNVDKLGNLIEETYKNGVKENKVYKRKSRI